MQSFMVQPPKIKDLIKIRRKMGLREEEEKELKEKLEELQKQLSKKQKFEESILSIKSLLRDFYASSSPSLRKSFYSAICRAATVLKTRYTAAGFWMAGLGLFEEAESLVIDSSEKQHLKNCILQAKQHVSQITDTHLPDVSSTSSRGGYLFEGHLTVDPEPPQPQWLVQSNLVSSMASLLAAAESSSSSSITSGIDINNGNLTESASTMLEQLMTNLDDIIPEFLDDESRAPRVPPASKEVVAKLPAITLTNEILAKLGQDAECAICKENLVLGDKMQELPCKHTFHPPCLKPWLDEHNSCPICRYELQTDDHAYESWKEREKEAEEERKGAANAVRGGEFLYI